MGLEILIKDHHQDRMMALDHLDRMEALDRLDRMEALDRLDRMEALDHLDRMEALDHQDRKEALDHLDRMEALDHRDKMEALDLQDKVVDLDHQTKMEVTSKIVSVEDQLGAQDSAKEQQGAAIAREVIMEDPIRVEDLTTREDLMEGTASMEELDHQDLVQDPTSMVFTEEITTKEEDIRETTLLVDQNHLHLEIIMLGL
jgi:hypothetical protein